MEERDAIKEKLNASKARIQILTKDMKIMKEHSKKLAEKEKHDDELVTALLVWLVICSRSFWLKFFYF